MGTFPLDIIHCLDEREVLHLLEWLAPSGTLLFRTHYREPILTYSPLTRRATKVFCSQQRW